jgi:hypothetical protein
LEFWQTIALRTVKAAKHKRDQVTRRRLISRKVIDGKFAEDLNNRDWLEKNRKTLYS